LVRKRGRGEGETSGRERRGGRHMGETEVREGEGEGLREIERESKVGMRER
jgi:hypothetical protein